jgi:hypothetical protein
MVRRSRFIGVGVGIGIGIDSRDAIVSVGAAHIVRRGGLLATKATPGGKTRRGYQSNPHCLPDFYL